MKNRVFYTTCLGFVCGVLFSSFVSVNLYVSILIGVISFAFIFFFGLLSKDKSDFLYKWGIIFSFLFFSFSFGIFRFQIANTPPPATLESRVEKEITLSGIIIDEPDVRENNQKLTVQIKNDKFKVKILLSVPLNEEYKYGDKIKFLGTLKKPENFITDQGKEFDYINYLRKDGIFYLVSYPKIDVVSHQNGNFIKSTLFYVKEKFLSKMNLVIRKPESLLMGGLILGEKSAFDESLRQSFVDTGTIHIVALSGYNVTIVAEWIMKIFSFGSSITGGSYLSPNIGIGVGIFSILLFVLMTGGASTALRAGIMASLALFARAVGRNYDVGRALVLAGVAMILVNPFILAFDVSFQLSFIATVAVIFFAPRIERYFMWVTPKFELRDIVSVTCAAYIFVLPFILYKMGNLSLVALPANILILPIIPLTMLFGFLTGFTGIIGYLFSIPFGFISYLMLHYELAVIAFFSHLPFAALSIPDFPFILTILIYVYFFYRLFGRSIKKFFIWHF